MFLVAKAVLPIMIAVRRGSIINMSSSIAEIGLANCASHDDPVAGLEVRKKRQLTGDLGRPEDVAAAALILASDESRFVLGSGLFVDGGVRGAK